jgi:hypothetical protein
LAIEVSMEVKIAEASDFGSMMDRLSVDVQDQLA